VEEEDCLRVQEDRVDVLVGARRVLAAGGHLEGAKKAGDQDFCKTLLFMCKCHFEKAVVAKSCFSFYFIFALLNLSFYWCKL
jgi:hypothetical protein